MHAIATVYLFLAGLGGARCRADCDHFCSFQVVAFQALDAICLPESHGNVFEWYAIIAVVCVDQCLSFRFLLFSDLNNMIKKGDGEPRQTRRMTVGDGRLPPTTTYRLAPMRRRGERLHEYI